MVCDPLTLKIVVDNEAAPGFVAEHGFALWIEAGDQRILFDTGQGKALLQNATALDIVPRQADALVLSHGHYDHTGGLPDVLQPPHHLQVYCHAAAFLPRYSIREGIAVPVKMTPGAMVAVHALPEDRIHWVTKPHMIGEHIGITGEIPRTTDFETTGGAFYFDQDGRRADPIKDDMALWIKSADGLVIVIGCCHAGLINTLTYIRELTGETRIHTLIGGLHLLHADQTRLARIRAELAAFDLRRIIPCHCTGAAAQAMLRDNFNCTPGYAGLEVRIATGGLA